MESSEIAKLLEQIRDLQQVQIERQTELLEAQREHMARYKSHLDRVERINAKAESIQDRGASLVGMARKALSVILIIVVFLIGYLSWLMFL
jgi:uncharacterized membrane protein (DUF106 family)